MSYSESTIFYNDDLKVKSKQSRQNEYRRRDRKRVSVADDSFVAVALPSLGGVLDDVRDVVLLVHADEEVRHRTWNRNLPFERFGEIIIDCRNLSKEQS